LVFVDNIWEVPLEEICVQWGMGVLKNQGVYLQTQVGRKVLSQNPTLSCQGSGSGVPLEMVVRGDRGV
jgi:hypothetical protein